MASPPSPHACACSPRAAFDADDAQLLGQVADYYAATLKQSPEALAYLEARGVAGAVAAEAIDTFKLGYANRTLGLRLPERSRKAGAEIRARLERLTAPRGATVPRLSKMPDPNKQGFALRRKPLFFQRFFGGRYWD